MSNIRKFKKSVKSQAALEFLTTYGWAFLVILIMVGALAYFGILSPSKLLPGRCSFGSEFQCLDYQVKYGGAATGSIKIKLKSNAGEPITTSAMTATTETTTALACGTLPTAITNWKTGGIQELTWSGCNSDAVGFIAGEKAKVNIQIDYYAVTSGSGYAKTVKGEVYTTVVA